MACPEIETYKRLLARISFSYIDAPSAFCSLCNLVKAGEYTLKTEISMLCKIIRIVLGSIITLVLWLFMVIHLIFCFIISLCESGTPDFLKDYLSYYYTNTLFEVIMFNCVFIIAASFLSFVLHLLTRFHFMCCFGGVVAAAMAFLDVLSAKYSMEHVVSPFYTQGIVSHTEDFVGLRAMMPYFIMIVVVYWAIYKDVISFVWSLKPKPQDESMDSLLPDHLLGKILVVRALGHYVEIITESERIEMRTSFSAALQRLRTESGLKVHRSYWVNNGIIESVEKKGNRFFARTSCGNIPVSPAMADKVAALATSKRIQ
ncbi:LytTR family DNA-binding domain-containing protein [Brucella sp. IR073]|uniref:LytTR family DNA-binding domain-containing protein n=1 Tax=unclassified Brucella TaxID=2632610 RepID=UPI003B986A5D